MKRAMAVVMMMIMCVAAGSTSIFARTHGADSDKYNAGAARAAGRDAMCLGMDLRHAEWMIRLATADQRFVVSAEDAVDAVLYHLDGTEEGEILWKVLEDENATVDDLGEAVGKVVVALMDKYQGEEQWAYYTGSVLIDIEYFAITGDEDSLRAAVDQLNEVIAEAEKYLSDEELKPLKELQALVSDQVEDEDDLLAMEAQVGNFINLYFDEA